MTRLSARPPIISIIHRAAQWPLDDNTCLLFLCVCVCGFLIQVHFYLYFVNKKVSTNLNNCLRNRVIKSLSYVVDWFSFKKKKPKQHALFSLFKTMNWSEALTFWWWTSHVYCFCVCGFSFIIYKWFISYTFFLDKQVSTYSFICINVMKNRNLWSELVDQFLFKKAKSVDSSLDSDGLQ